MKKSHKHAIFIAIAVALTIITAFLIPSYITYPKDSLYEDFGIAERNEPDYPPV